MMVSQFQKYRTCTNKYISWDKCYKMNACQWQICHFCAYEIGRKSMIAESVQNDLNRHLPLLVSGHGEMNI